VFGALVCWKNPNVLNIHIIQLLFIQIWYSCFEIFAHLLCHFHQFELGLELRKWCWFIFSDHIMCDIQVFGYFLVLTC